MSLWNGSAIATAEAAMVFNKLHNTRSLSLTAMHRGFLYAVMGRPKIAGPQGVTRFPRTKSITGKKIEVRFLGKLVEMEVLANAAADLALIDAASLYDNDAWGAQEFDPVVLFNAYPIPGRELDRFKGQEAKTANFLKEVYMRIEESWDSELSVKATGTGGINSAAAPLSSALGGWQWPVSDGVSAGETGFAVYGTIDRSDSDNVRLRAYVLNAAGELTLPKLRQARLQARKNTGNPSLGVVGDTLYDRIYGMVEAFGNIQRNNPEWMQFGSDWFGYNNVIYTLDSDVPDGIVGLLDPKSFHVYLDNDLPFTDFFGKVDQLKDGYLVKSKVRIQLICVMPRANAKIVNAA